ncbi:FAD:protein FMN transferase [Parabacteroides sp. OttesenSCG-928-O15]|nr:FAD:protein FMN transferase [Parabacteroides sp. OttesenSCG-928-O15]
METAVYSTYYPDSRLFHGLAEPIMGTRLEVLLIGKEKTAGEQIWAQLTDEIRAADRLMNKFNPESELYMVNSLFSMRPVAVSDALWDILTDCYRYYQLTSGYFDISLQDFSAVEFTESEHSVFSSLKGLTLDLGGYGKGYALEKVRGILESHEVESALVNFGNSSVLGVGTHVYGDHWPIGIQDPQSGKDIGLIHLKDSSMSTSGNSPRNPAHVINPHTQAPYIGRQLVTVHAPNALDAEVLSTALLVMEKQERESVLSHFNIYEYRVFDL